jgi:hypothetical protein
MPVSCFLAGGLGNQLFQIYTTIAYALSNNIPFYFVDIHELHSGTSHSSVVQRHTYWHTFLSSLRPWLKPSNCSIAYNAHIHNEPSMQYSAIPAFTNTLLRGYFQSPKYFNGYRDCIYTLLQIKKWKEHVLSSPYFSSLTSTAGCFAQCAKSAVEERKRTISLHYRSGDYKQYSHIYPILTKEYYEAALRRLIWEEEEKRRKKNDTQRQYYVLCFTEPESYDELEANILRPLRDVFPNVEFISMANQFHHDFEEMVAMSLCQDNIIANSTFSWFSAYWNTNEGRRIIYPAQWFHPELDKKHDLFADLNTDVWISV